MDLITFILGFSGICTLDNGITKHDWFGIVGGSVMVLAALMMYGIQVYGGRNDD